MGFRAQILNRDGMRAQTGLSQEEMGLELQGLLSPQQQHSVADKVAIAAPFPFPHRGGDAHRHL